jgi:dihydrofolate reductase
MSSAPPAGLSLEQSSATDREEVMRKVIVQVSISADGFVASEKGGSDHRGIPEDPALKKLKLEWLGDVGTHAMGRVTYEQMAAHWPDSTDAYAAPMNEVPKVVFSTTLKRADWPLSRIAGGDIAEEIRALRAQPGGYIAAWGGAAFLQSLARARLVDEYRLVINPVALGRGLPLFQDLPEPLHLELVQARAFSSGAALHVYRPRSRQPADRSEP